MTGLTVRAATARDAALIGSIHVVAWREAYAELLPADRLAALDIGERTAMWQRILASGVARGLAVAVLDAEVIGFASCARQRSPELADQGYSGEVAALYVLRRAQGLGAGRALMQAMARRLIAEGERGIALWVLTRNRAGRRFYERLGGRLVGERGDGADAEVAYGWQELSQLL